MGEGEEAEVTQILFGAVTIPLPTWCMGELGILF